MINKVNMDYIDFNSTKKSLKDANLCRAKMIALRLEMQGLPYRIKDAETNEILEISNWQIVELMKTMGEKNVNIAIREANKKKQEQPKKTAPVKTAPKPVAPVQKTTAPVQQDVPVDDYPEMSDEAMAALCPPDDDEPMMIAKPAPKKADEYVVKYLHENGTMRESGICDRETAMKHWKQLMKKNLYIEVYKNGTLVRTDGNK